MCRFNIPSFSGYASVSTNFKNNGTLLFEIARQFIGVGTNGNSRVLFPTNMRLPSYNQFPYRVQSFHEDFTAAVMY
jgi:hypothetical protein